MERTSALRRALLQNHSNHEVNEILIYRPNLKGITLIGDASFFRTIYFGDVPQELKNLINRKFGEGKDIRVMNSELSI